MGERMLPSNAIGEFKIQQVPGEELVGLELDLEWTETVGCYGAHAEAVHHPRGHEVTVQRTVTVKAVRRG